MDARAHRLSPLHHSSSSSSLRMTPLLLFDSRTVMRGKPPSSSRLNLTVTEIKAIVRRARVIARSFLLSCAFAQSTLDAKIDRCERDMIVGASVSATS